jgi:hypothetical protein
MIGFAPPRQLNRSALSLNQMQIRPIRLHVCFGTPPQHLERLKEIAASGEPDWWTINSEALPGDQIAFYMKRPLSQFVAVGVVATEPWFIDDETDDWFGHYAADVTDVAMLPHPVSIVHARQRFPSWGWLRQPRRSTRVPGQIANKFLQFLGGSHSDGARYGDEGDIEGTKTEVLRLTTKRSRRLRDLAFRAANNICSVCDRDFSTVLDGRGVRVLQVHHRKQLAARDAPSLTKVSDLVVVCANCHLLIHLDPKKALSVRTLRNMLRANGS